MGQEQSTLETVRRHDYRQSALKSNSQRIHNEKNIPVSRPILKSNRNGGTVQDVGDSCGPSSLTDMTTAGKGNQSNTLPLLTNRKKRSMISQSTGKAGKSETRKSENFSRVSIKSYFSSWSDQPRRFSSNLATAEDSPDTHQKSREDTQSLEIIHELPGTVPSDLHVNGLNSNLRSKTRSYTSMRPSSLRQPAVATRTAIDARNEEVQHGLLSLEPSQRYPSSSGFEHTRDDSQSSFLQFQNRSLQPQRTETPSDLEHGHIGAFKLGSLRITNGAASPTPSREQGQDEKKSLLTNQKKRFQDHSQHKTSLSRDISKSWDVSRESPLRQTQDHDPQSSGAPLRHPSFDFESSNIHEIIVSSNGRAPQASEVHEDCFISEELTPFSFFDSPHISPVARNSKIRIAVRDGLFDEEPWTPSIKAITKPVQLQKPSLLKADSGYASNISSKSSENEVLPKINQFKEDRTSATRAISGPFSFTSSTKSKDFEAIKAVEKSFASTNLQMMNGKDEDVRLKQYYHTVEEKEIESSRHDQKSLETSGFRNQPVSQDNAKATIPNSDQNSLDLRKAYTPKTLTSKVDSSDDLQHLPIESCLKFPEAEMNSPLTSRESPKTFFFDATPPISARAFKSNHSNFEAYEDDKVCVFGEVKNTKFEDSKFLVARSENDKGNTIESASTLSPTIISNIIQTPSKKHFDHSFLDPNIMDMPRTPSLTNSMRTFTTEAVVTPETQLKTYSLQQDIPEFIDVATPEKNPVVFSMSTHSTDLKINSASASQPNTLPAQKQPSLSRTISSSAHPSMSGSLSEPPDIFGNFINTEAKPSHEKFNSNIKEFLMEFVPSRNQTSPPPSVPPQSKRRVSYIPSPLKPEINQALSSKSVGNFQYQNLTNRTTSEKVLEIAHMNENLTFKATHSPTTSVSFDKEDTEKTQNKTVERLMKNGTAQKAALKSSSVSNIVASLQEKSLNNQAEINLERPTVKKFNLYLEKTAEKDGMPLSRMPLRSEEPRPVKKFSKNRDLSIDTKKASSLTKYYSIEVSNTHQNAAEIPIQSRISNSTNVPLSVSVPEPTPYQAAENIDQSQNQELRRRSLSTSEVSDAKILSINETTSKNLPSTRRYSKPVRYRRPPLTPPPSSSLKMTNIFSARNVEQQTIDRRCESPSKDLPSNLDLSSSCFSDLTHDSCRIPQRQEWRRKSSIVFLRPASPELDIDFLHLNRDKQTAPRRSVDLRNKAGASTDDLCFPTAPMAQKKKAPVVVVSAKGSNSLRRSKASYPPQAHANRHSHMMFARTPPPPIPKILDFYSQIENTQKQMEKIHMPQISSQHSPSFTSKLNEKSGGLLSKTVQKRGFTSSLAQISGISQRVTSDGENFYEKNLLAQQQFQTPVTPKKSRSTSSQSTTYHKLILPEHCGNFACQSTDQDLLKASKSLEIKTEWQLKQEESDLNHEQQENFGAESVSLILNSALTSPYKLSTEMNQQIYSEKTLQSEDLQNSTTRIIDANYPKPSSGIVRRSKPQDLVLQPNQRGVKMPLNCSSQPSLRPKFLHQNSIDSLPSQSLLKVKTPESISQHAHCNVLHNLSSRQSSSTRSSSIRSCSVLSSLDAQSRESTDYSPLCSPWPEVKSRDAPCEDQEIPNSLKLINPDITSSTSIKPDHVITPTHAIQASLSQTSSSSRSFTPRLRHKHDDIDVDLAKLAIDETTVKNATQLMPIPMKILSSIDTLPSQRNRLRYSSIEIPGRQLLSENQELNCGKFESSTRIPTPVGGESAVSYSPAKSTRGFPGQVRTPSNLSLQGSSLLSPNNFPSIPKSINTYHYSSALPSQNMTHSFYQNGAGRISRSPSVNLSPASSFMTHPEDREIVVLAAGWR